jgi:hypothetical protein
MASVAATSRPHSASPSRPSSTCPSSGAATRRAATRAASAAPSAPAGCRERGVEVRRAGERGGGGEGNGSASEEGDDGPRRGRSYRTGSRHARRVAPDASSLATARMLARSMPLVSSDCASGGSSSLLSRSLSAFAPPRSAIGTP